MNNFEVFHDLVAGGLVELSHLIPCLHVQFLGVRPVYDAFKLGHPVRKQDNVHVVLEDVFVVCAVDQK